MRSLLAVLLLAALAAPIAADAATPTLLKVSAYGVQRYSTHGTTDWEEGCRGERGESSFSVVTRFKTKRTTRVRLVRYGPIAALQPATKADWELTGTANAKASGHGEQAFCSAVNPDSSIKWIPSEPYKTRCSADDLHQDAHLKLEGRKLTFSAGDTLLAPLADPFRDCKSSNDVIDLATATGRVALRQITAADGEPIVLRYRDDGGSATDKGSSEWHKRLTVYVTFTPIRSG